MSQVIPVSTDFFMGSGFVPEPTTHSTYYKELLAFARNFLRAYLAVPILVRITILIQGAPREN